MIDATSAGSALLAMKVGDIGVWITVDNMPDADRATAAAMGLARMIAAG